MSSELFFRHGSIRLRSGQVYTDLEKTRNSKHEILRRTPCEGNKFKMRTRIEGIHMTARKNVPQTFNSPSSCKVAAETEKAPEPFSSPRIGAIHRAMPLRFPIFYETRYQIGLELSQLERIQLLNLRPLPFLLFWIWPLLTFCNQNRLPQFLRERGHNP